jgi:uncharacterized protein YfiM (DUF2279 family)
MKKDKITHFCAGAMVAVLVGLPAYLESGNLFAGIWSALTSGIIAGGVKEWCDMRAEGNKWDWLDFGCTCLGAVIVALLIVGMHFGKG